ncbi:MAG: RNB domain-containing ribonuclease [Thermodesulfobacteriota bacterium]|nr:RNB domain-containing ribonuclease [Thermodesulfobacteriota bacterium]
MEKGTIVEYIDNEKLICAVNTDTVMSGAKRLRLLTENSREVNLPARRISHAGGRLDVSAGRQDLARGLKSVSEHRSALADQINPEELWDLVQDEARWFSARELAELCFAETLTPDHEAAVIRAFFRDRLYFKFNHDRFYPHTEQQLHAILVRREKEARRQRVINEGAQWLKTWMDGEVPVLDDRTREFVDILKPYYIFDKDAPDYALAREMLAKAGGVSPDTIFFLMVRLGIWDENENIDIPRSGIPVDWPEPVLDRAREIVAAPHPPSGPDRVDISTLPVFTIDGSSTLDFDDALSVEEEGDGIVRVGIHISDVAHTLPKGDLLDEDALGRGSSIYTPDRKISMLPPELSEDVCSLKAGQLRPAISTFIRFSQAADVMDTEVLPTLIMVDHHLVYSEVDRNVWADPRLALLHRLSEKLFEKRLKAGAVPINIPEIVIQFGPNGTVNVSKMDRESPSRLLVAEMMIAANWAAARFLQDNDIPSIYRSQPEPKQRLVKRDTQEEDSLFNNWVQRKMVARVVLDQKPERHSGLGVDLYTTATSPIRKYLDLITQRQIRAALGLERPYTPDEIGNMVQLLEQPLSCVGKIQQGRQRYWILKHLETLAGTTTEAIVLDKFKNDYSILLPDFLVECRLPASAGTKLKPRDIIRVTIQHVSARNNLISVFPG